MKINILGADYTVTCLHNDRRMENMYGFCVETSKEIVVEIYEGCDCKPGVKGQLDIQGKKNFSQ